MNKLYLDNFVKFGFIPHMKNQPIFDENLILNILNFQNHQINYMREDEMLGNLSKISNSRNPS